MCSYNMHGFNNGLSMVKSLCSNHDFILLQEHWLLKSDLYKIDHIDQNFQSYSLSSMNTKASSGILTGRPFGGISILWRKDLSKSIKLLEGDSDGKFLSIKMCNVGLKDLIITCVYFPCLSALSEYVVNSSLITAHIENVLCNYSDCEHIIAGDFNFECRQGNAGYDLFFDIINDYSLICCDNIHSSKNVGYTYYHETLNQHSWLDHVFVSHKLIGCVIATEIIDTGENLSDHLPISWTVKYQPVL